MSLSATNIFATIDLNCKTTSTSYPLADKARDVNMALDKVLSMIFSVGGTWQFDDANHTDYPIITTNLVAGQRDYSFTQDGSSNLILEVYRVACADENGNFHDLTPSDVSGKNSPLGFIDGQNTQGQPYTYDKLGNGIFLEQIPSYSYAAGLKIYINREASYFVSTDTTKKPGFAGIYHEYLALRPSYQFAYRNGKQNAQALQNEMIRMEQEIMEFYSKRAKDERKVLTGFINNAR